MVINIAIVQWLEKVSPLPPSHPSPKKAITIFTMTKDSNIRSYETKKRAFWPIPQSAVMWRKSNIANVSKNTILIVKYGNGNLMLWGYFSIAGTGELKKVWMEIKSSISISEENLFQLTVQLGIERGITYQ